MEEDREGWSRQVVPLHHCRLISLQLPPSWDSGQSGFASVSMSPCSWVCSNMAKHPSASSFCINEDEDVEKSSTRHDKEQVRKARAAAKNTFQFVCMMSQDWEFWRRKSYLICDVSMFIQQWHSFQTNRSARESLQWHRDRACDLGPKHIHAILSKVSSASLLSGKN